MRIRPVSAVNYKFAGWNISLVEVNKLTGKTIIKESYDLKLKTSTSDTNMLKPTYVGNKKVTSVWGSLNNVIVSTDVCVLAQEVQYKTISFGSFTVIDRAGFTGGDLMIKIPGLTCEYTTKRTYLYDTLTSIYGKVGNITKENKDYYLEKGYSLNDQVGLSYIEKQYDEYLKGTKAEYLINEDNSLTKIKDSSPGNDIYLSIDIDLQLKINEIIKLITPEKRKNVPQTPKSKVTKGLHGSVCHINPKPSAV
jgi:hypothetical protein